MNEVLYVHLFDRKSAKSVKILCKSGFFLFTIQEWRRQVAWPGIVVSDLDANNFHGQ